MLAHLYFTLGGLLVLLKDLGLLILDFAFESIGHLVSLGQDGFLSLLLSDELILGR